VRRFPKRVCKINVLDTLGVRISSQIVVQHMLLCSTHCISNKPAEEQGRVFSILVFFSWYLGHSSPFCGSHPSAVDLGRTGLNSLWIRKENDVSVLIQNFTSCKCEVHCARKPVGRVKVSRRCPSDCCPLLTVQTGSDEDAERSLRAIKRVFRGLGQLVDGAGVYVEVGDLEGSLQPKLICDLMISRHNSGVF